MKEDKVMYKAFVDCNGDLIEYEYDDSYNYDDCDCYDDIDVSCSDCPDDECTGHCYSCPYCAL